MPKGEIELYDDICKIMAGEKFIDWITDANPEFRQGMICKTIAWYVKSDRWYLEEHDYHHLNEADSTWYARQYTGKYPKSNSSNVMKYFKLESDERLLTTNGKERPVILLRREKNDWWNPSNSQKHDKTWLCLPLFSYKPRHNQEYVLNEVRMNSDNAFYIPSYYESEAGIENESSARIQSLQMINEEHLCPLKRHCIVKEPQMQRPFQLTKTGLEILMHHFYRNFNVLKELEESSANYNIFKDEVNRRIDIALKS